MGTAEPRRVAAQNRRARHDYLIEDTLEAGLVLAGSEVKSLRAGRASIGEAYAGQDRGELWLFNAYIPEYSPAHAAFAHETRRARKLLVHKRQRSRLFGAIKREGITLIPLSIYFNDRGLAKVQFLDDDRVLCEDAVAPYECPFQPRGGDVGRNTLVAIAVDTAGQTTSLARDG